MHATATPGPQDYGSVNPDVYLRRGTVIPQLAFSKSLRETKSATKIDIRARSPGPNLYRPKSDTVLNRSPSATIGRDVRWAQR